MKILSTHEFLEGLNIGKLNIRDVKLPEPRLLPDELVNKYNLSLNKITGRYDCDDNIRVEQDLVKDGKLITDFGVVKGSFNCSNNKLTSLEGCPVEVGGNFSCTYNGITSLEGCPVEVDGNFYCSWNKLTSLEGCPAEVHGGFYCFDNSLTSLEGCPTKVGGGFNCSNNKLTSLKGCPVEIGGHFDCYDNQLTSLEGCPAEVGGNFYCKSDKNEHKFTEDEVRTLCNVKQKIYV